jgi:hypothetical protein
LAVIADDETMAVSVALDDAFDLIEQIGTDGLCT